MGLLERRVLRARRGVGVGEAEVDEQVGRHDRRGGAWVLKDGAWAAMKGSVDTKLKTALEPAATMAWSKDTVVVEPSSARTESRCAPAKRASPWTTCTLRCLAMPVTPLTSLATTPSFHVRSASTSTSGLANAMPCSLICSASVITFAACSSALDGMQPTFRHTPPSVA